MATPTLFTTSETGAEFSPCRTYRYKLWRTWDEGQACSFICLNPSTADDVIDDPTISRLTVRAKRWGYGGLIVTNLFAFRETYPSEMRRAVDPVGPDNDRVITETAAECPLVVCGWGNNGTHRARNVAVLNLLRPFAEKVTAIKLSKGGHPWHPLYLPYSLTPVPFRF